MSCEICILAGGLSRRMGRNKAGLRLGRRTMLGHIRAAATATGFPVRVIREDVVRRCGPIGGVYTALITTPADTVLFLACDMPFVSSHLIQFLVKGLTPKRKAAFVESGDGPGFPFVLRRTTLDTVAKQIQNRKFSLRALAEGLKATIVHMPTHWEKQLKNINTPEEWREVRN